MQKVACVLPDIKNVCAKARDEKLILNETDLLLNGSKQLTAVRFCIWAILGAIPKIFKPPEGRSDRLRETRDFYSGPTVMRFVEDVGIIKTISAGISPAC